MGKPAKKRRRRRRTDYEEDLDPPPMHEQSWSGRKTLSVLGGVIGTPFLVLMIIGRSDIVRAIGFGLLLFGVILISALRWGRRAEWWLDD